jgi:hypothetical protein
VTRRPRALVIVIIAAALPLSGAASAWATAQPLTPAQGAVVNSSHPLFTWSLPANEHSQALYVANKPDTTPDGSFYIENVSDVGFFYPDDPRQYSPTSGLYAGRYWWLVESYDLSTYQTYRSAPSAFTIPAASSVVGLRTRRYRFLRNLDFEAHWRSNIERPVVRASLSTGTGRVTWSEREREYNSLGSSQSSSFSWYAPRRVKAGTRLRLQIRVGGASLRRVVRAP